MLRLPGCSQLRLCIRSRAGARRNSRFWGKEQLRNTYSACLNLTWCSLLRLIFLSFTRVRGTAAFQLSAAEEQVWPPTSKASAFKTKSSSLQLSSVTKSSADVATQFHASTCQARSLPNACSMLYKLYWRPKKILDNKTSIKSYSKLWKYLVYN